MTGYPMTIVCSRSVLLALLVAAPLAHQAALAGPTAAPPAGNPEAGKKVFMRCAECHQVGPSARGGYGPQLNGIVGRPAAATKDFVYSPAMRASAVIWSEATLRAFVKSPGAVVPGNKMNFWGLSNEQQITDLLAYLRSVH